MRNSSQRTPFTVRLRVLLGAAAIAVAAACSSESATAPAELDVAARAGTLPPGQARKAVGLERLTAASKPLTVSKRFSSKYGGTLVLSDLNVKLTIPEGAIPRDTMTITMTVIPGKIVAYDFAPHGAKFLKPLTLSIDVSATKHSLKTSPLFGGHFTSNRDVDAAKGTAWITEVISASLRGNILTLNPWHFSGWMVSSGFVDEGI
jgi:hypothetical protein